MLNHGWSLIAHADAADLATVMSYLFAAALAARAAARTWLNRERSLQCFWRAVAIVMVLLGVNELLDLQTLLTACGRDHAKAAGWYEQRRTVQYVFVITFAAASIVGSVALLWVTRRAPVSARVAALGLLLILVFVLIRAASFHHIDVFLGSKGPVSSWAMSLEIAGILVVALAAARGGDVRCR